MFHNGSSDKSANCTRNQIFVASKPQGVLMLQTLAFCAVTCFAMAFNHFMIEFFAPETGPLIKGVVSVGVAFCLVAPVALWIQALSTAKIFASIPRIQSAFRRLHENEDIAPLEVRDGDHWVDWIHEFNSMVTRGMSEQFRNDPKTSSCMKEQFEEGNQL